MQENRQIFHNMVWGFIATGLSYLVSFLLTPYITRKLGIEAYGFISLATIVTSYIDIISVALNGFAARYIAIEYHNGRIEKANSYFNSVFVADLVFIAVASVPSVIIITQLEHFIIIPESNVFDVKIMFMLVFINYCINILGTLFSSLLFIKNKTSTTYRNKGISTIIYVLSIVSIIVLLEFRLYSVAIAQVVSSSFYYLANRKESGKIIPEVRVNIRCYSSKSLKRVISSGIWNSINNLGSVLNNGLDLLVSNRMLDNTVMGQVSIAKQISNIYNAISVILVQSFQSTQLECYSKGDKTGLIRSFNKSIKISGVIGCTIFGGYIILGKQFLNLWLGGSNTNIIYEICLITLVGDFMLISNRPLFYIFTLTDKLSYNCWITLITGAVNFLGMIVFLKVTNLGGYIVVGSTVVSYALTIWTISLQGKKYLNLEKNPFNAVIMKNYLVACLYLLVGTTVKLPIEILGWTTFLAYGFILGLLLLFLSSLLLLNQEERKAFWSLTRFSFRRDKR